MPSVPTYLAGVHSNKVRNFLNYFNGLAGILKLTPTGRDPSGLTFTVQTHDAPHEAIGWACVQAGNMLYVRDAADDALFRITTRCESAGALDGTARCEFLEGQWFVHMQFQPAKPTTKAKA